MRIAVHTDSLIANIPLMKISKYYGDVEWYMPLEHYEYDKIFYSKIFNFTPYPDRHDEMIIGGTGHNLTTVLPEEIESCDLDYSIYPDCDYSLQYFSRGCVRKCDFCVVPEKEGMIRAVEPMNLNPKGEYIRVLDNNFFANKKWPVAIDYLKKNNQPVYWDSGLDIRLFNDEQGEALKTLKLHKMMHIAWDDPKQDLSDKIKLMCKYIKPYRIMVYVLIGFNSTHEENMYRVMTVKDLGCDPFVMPYNKKDDYQKRFARWVNHKAVFGKVSWDEYDRKKEKEITEPSQIRMF